MWRGLREDLPGLRGGRSMTLPPFGLRVYGILPTGGRKIIYRRKMPRGGWVWASPYTQYSISPADIAGWEMK
jgi:hypothetical protein